MGVPQLSDRERRVLEAVVQTYVETAQPAGSKVLAERFGFRMSSERLLVALTLSRGAVRTIFVDVKGEIADAAIVEVTAVLNERLAGLSLREIAISLGERLRDTSTGRDASELLNVFIEEGDQV